MRRWNGTTWDLLEGPLNAGGGEVRVMTVSATEGGIAWLDGDGAIHVRVRNW